MNDTPTRTPEAILANLTLDLTQAAVIAGAAYAAGTIISTVTGAPPGLAISGLTEMWESLTGLTGEDAEALALHIVGHHDHVTAAVTPW